MSVGERARREKKPVEDETWKRKEATATGHGV
jgi:hypothetical protein